MDSVKIEKPENWPLNAFEDLLERVQTAMIKFLDNPGFQTREVLVSLINAHDFNQQSVFGDYRIVDYEVAILNFLFMKSLEICYPSLRCFLYSFIGFRTRMQKMIHLASQNIPEIDEALPINIEAYENGLHPTLFQYYKQYQYYTINKENTFSEVLCLFANNEINYCTENKNVKSLEIFERSFTTIFNDISFARGNKAEDIWRFDRKELISLFSVQAQMLNVLGRKPSERPLRTMLIAEIGNYLLRSRNHYNHDLIYKYISEENAALSFKNCEIWMSAVEKLNDSREGKVIEEVFADRKWIKASWVSDSISFKKKRMYYVSCFSKSGIIERMKNEYGSVILGYKNDRIGDLISPIRKYELKHKSDDGKTTTTYYVPLFSTVIAFDVLYDREKLKDELSFLFKIIDLFSMSILEKNSLLENLLQYWLLSAKDEKWEYERERRYVLFVFEENEYYETNIDSDYLKEKTSLFVLPDFVLGNHQNKCELRKNIEGKRKAISSRPFFNCHTCFYVDYDLAHTTLTEIGKCPVCGSEDIVIENSRY